MVKKGMKGFMKRQGGPGGQNDEDDDEPQTASSTALQNQGNNIISDKKVDSVTKEEEEDEDSDEDKSGPETKSKMLKRHQREMQAHKKTIQRAGKKSKEDLAKLNKEIEDRHARELRSLESASVAQPPPAVKPALVAPEPLMAKLALTGPENDVHLKTKAMKRREKLEREEAERAARIAEEASSMGPSDKLLEEERLQDLLRPLGLSMKEIKADGNCLFRSIEASLIHSLIHR